MALVQAEVDEVTELVGVEDLRPEQVVQAVHQLQGEVLELSREDEQLPDNVGDDTAAVLILHSEILQHGELSLRHGQQLPVVQYVRQRQLPSLRPQVSSISKSIKVKILGNFS